MNGKETLEHSLKAAFRARRRRAVEPCLEEERLVSFSMGELGEEEAEAVRNHLSECPKCLEVARDARQFLQAMGEGRPAEAHAVPSGRWILLLAASIAVALAAGLIVTRMERKPHEPTSASRANPWRDLRIVKADYAAESALEEDVVWRSGEEETPAAIAKAMQPYERSDFAEAESRLRELLEKDPEHAAAHFYRGVSLLILGRTAQAVEALQTAAAQGDEGLREEAHWYLALALLKTGDVSRAREQLDAVVLWSGARASEAERLRREVEAFEAGR